MIAVDVILALVSGLAICALATSAARAIGSHRGADGEGGGAGSSPPHVSLLGGIAILVAFLFSLAPLSFHFRTGPWVAGFAAALLVALLGFVDDCRPLSPLVKLLGQIGCVAVLTVADVQTDIFESPVLNAGMTAVWFLVVMNAINLLDNMDGLAAGVAVIVSGFFVSFALLHGQWALSIASAALMGACAGFLVHNFHPARIFMGDSGSLFIGFILALMGMEFHGPGHLDGAALMVPVLVLGLPLFDTAFVSVSRLRRRIPIWHGGHDHVSHRLVRQGWTIRRTVSFLYAVCALLGFGAAAVVHLGARAAYPIGAIAIAGSLVGGWWLESRIGVRDPDASAAPVGHSAT